MAEISLEENTIISWLSWQFYQMPRFLFKVWNNYFIFVTNFFSLSLLLKTFFAPWRKYRWSYPKGLDVGAFFSTLISNIFSRFLGALMRVVLIITGIFFQVFIAIFGAVAILLWYAVPFIIIGGVIVSIVY